MTLTLDQVLADTAKLTLPVAGTDLTVTYRPGAVTEEALAITQLLETSDPNRIIESFKSFNETLVSLLVDWNFYEDQAETIKVPITVERLAKLPIALRLTIYTGVMGDIRPNQIATQMN